MAVDQQTDAYDMIQRGTLVRVIESLMAYNGVRVVEALVCLTD